ncbi:MAG: DUF6359 domain-containing protein [Bacteroidaceae bacterium]|nr:DUF6359 domain-containing protein [Bacteroidaceae bacterium]
MRKLYSLCIALLAVCGLANAQVTFDFTGETAYEQFGLAGFSNSESKAGDITADATVTSGDISITVSAAAEGASNPNRMWGTVNKETSAVVGSLRMYSGTLTIESAGQAMTSIQMGYGKWNDGNTADCGTLASGKWTGSSNKVVITIAANTQLKNITVNFGENPTPDPDPEEIDWTSSATAPLTVPQLLERAAKLQQGENSSSNAVYVKGKISQIKYTFSAQYGTAQFHISEDGQQANEFLCYGSLYLGNRSWVDGDTQIAVGDEVIMCGTVTNYKGTLEYANKKNYIYSLNGVTDGGEVVVPEYTKIADIKAAATTAHVQVLYKASDVLVSFVNGRSVYVYDGTDGLLLYGDNSGIKTGDKVSLTAKGELYLYNGLTEISVTEYADLKVASSDNAVEPQKVTIADLVDFDKYENELVVMEELTPAAEAWSNRNIVFVDDSDNEVTIRDNFNTATTLTFDTSKSYTVTGFVSIYQNDSGSTIQIYPRDAEDLSNGTAPVEYEFTGDGTLNNPFTVEDVQHIVAPDTKTAVKEDAWVKAYIVGYINGSSLSDKTAMFTANAPEGTDKNGEPLTTAVSNILVADATDAATISAVVPVALPSKSVARTDLNLADNPDKLHTQVWLNGNIIKYMGVTGLKEVYAYSLDGTAIVDAIRDVHSATAEGAIYNLAGQRMQNINRSGIYLINGKKVVVK